MQNCPPCRRGYPESGPDLQASCKSRESGLQSDRSKVEFSGFGIPFHKTGLSASLDCCDGKGSEPMIPAGPAILVTRLRSRAARATAHRSDTCPPASGVVQRRKCGCTAWAGKGKVDVARGRQDLWTGGCRKGACAEIRSGRSTGCGSGRTRYAHVNGSDQPTGHAEDGDRFCRRGDDQPDPATCHRVLRHFPPFARRFESQGSGRGSRLKTRLSGDAMKVPSTGAGTSRCSGTVETVTFHAASRPRFRVTSARKGPAIPACSSGNPTTNRP